jgi:hypothetical protein
VECDEEIGKLSIGKSDFRRNCCAVADDFPIFIIVQSLVGKWETKS